MLEKARERDVKFMLAVATTLPGYEAMTQLIGDRPDVAFSCGVHPLNMMTVMTSRNFAVWPPIPALWRWVKPVWTISIRNKPPAEVQQDSFRHHIRIGRELNKPVIVHTRDARQDTLDILHEEKVPDCGGVLHCFTEDLPKLQKSARSGLLYFFLRHCDLPQC